MTAISAPERPVSASTTSLRTALLWRFAAMFVPLLLLGTALVVQHWRQQRELVMSRLHEHVVSLRDAVERELALDQAVLRTLAALPDFDEQDWRGLHATAKSAAESRPNSWIVVVDPDGQYVVNTLVPFGAPLPNVRTMPNRPASVAWRGRELTFPPWRNFEEPLRTGQPFFTDLTYGPVVKGPVVAVNAPVLREGTARYVISLAYAPDFFVRMLKSRASANGLISVIFDRRGVVIARSAMADAFIGGHVAPPLDKGLADMPAEGQGEIVTLEGIPAFFAYSRVATNGWGIGVAAPRDAALAPAWRATWIWLAILATTALIAALSAGSLWRRLALPLATLARHARSPNAGLPPGPRSGIEEVEVLRQAMEEAAKLEQVRRRAEQERERAEARFRLVVESSPMAELMVDRAGTISLVNHQVEVLFGYARNELLGQPVELLLPGDRRVAHAALRAAYEPSPVSRPMGKGRSLLGRRRDGTEFPVEVWLVSLETAEGTFVLATIADISERKRAEDELRRSNQELEQFAYIASHDLQEPLRMVASYTELLGQRYRGRLDEKADKYIGYAVDGAKRMRGLITDLLAFSKVGSQARALEPVETAPVVADLLQMMRATLDEAGAVVETGPLPVVMADRAQLAQVFQNLIGNAVKFRSDRPPRIAVQARRADGAWEFSVSDNGIGFEPRYAERIFLMFQSLHGRSEYDGSGIGLAIVKRIVERHGGRVWAESTPGSGTTVRFTLLPPPAEPPGGS